MLLYKFLIELIFQPLLHKLNPPLLFVEEVFLILQSICLQENPNLQQISVYKSLHCPPAVPIASLQVYRLQTKEEQVKVTKWTL